MLSPVTSARASATTRRDFLKKLSAASGTGVALLEINDLRSLSAAGITVGRDPKSDIVISDPRASYHHAWVGIIEQKAVLRDLDKIMR